MSYIELLLERSIKLTLYIRSIAENAYFDN